MQGGLGEQVHSPGGFRMGGRPTSMARDHWLVGVSCVLDGDWPSRADIRDDVRGTAGGGSGSEGTGDAEARAGTSDPAKRRARYRARRRCLVKLALFYAFIFLTYLALTLWDRPLAEQVFPFVALMLLAPALYTEALRVKGHD